MSKMDYERAKELFDCGNYSEALKAYLELAASGCVKSRIYLGWMYQEGIGTTPNLQEAERWYGEAANLGSPEAQFRLAKIYAKRGERSTSIDWYQKSAANGYSPALFRLGWLYETGKGVVRNQSKAISFYKKAAELGHVFAQKQLGVLLIQGAEGFLGRFAGMALVMKSIVRTIKIGFKDQHDERLLD